MIFPNQFDEAFRCMKGAPPFPWQTRLFKQLRQGNFPRALDLPTGLGKTSVMAIWLLARAFADKGALTKIPRRLVYVVDRRAVVDQATEEAEGLCRTVEKCEELRNRLGLSGALPVSTLRGQHVDNREWLADPSAPTIIVGTVDMIGSRLLFEGYGVSRKMRPYHAGLLGVDTLVVLDEAHLVPPFEALLAELSSGTDTFGPSAPEGCALPVPRLRLLSLSATGRDLGDHSCNHKDTIFTLDHTDRAHGEVRKRLHANKQVKIAEHGSANDALASELASQAWELADRGKIAIRCLIYADSRDVAEKTKKKLEELGEAAIGLLVGARRVREREQIRQWLDDQGFLAGTSKALEQPAFLIATSAGEVGIDLDADHMVCDLVPWERMVQRLGRVNRRGEKSSQVIVVHGNEPKLKKSKGGPTEVEQRALCAWHGLELLKQLPEVGDGRDASPAALLELKQRAQVCAALERQLREATTPEPLRPALTRALAEAWAMTSLDEHPGRPDIQPWLRGWVEDEPQTSVIWRHYLPVPEGSTPSLHNPSDRARIEAFFEAAPPHRSEMLETERKQVAGWLNERAEALLKKCDAPDKDREQNSDEDGPSARPALKSQDVVALLLRQDGGLEGAFTLADLSTIKKEQLTNPLLIVDARLGGLKDGLLGSDCAIASSADADPVWSAEIGFRVRLERTTEEKDPVRPLADAAEWLPALAINLACDAEGNPQERLIVEQRAVAAQAEDARALSNPQTLAEHQAWTQCKARNLAARLGLTEDAAEALAVAALLHDEGKRAERWQRAFRAQRDAARYQLAPPLAKTRGPIDQALLDGYRHEFGSLPYAQKNIRFQALDPEWQEMVLHLVAAHHGQARPVIATSGCDDAPPSALAARAQEVALRFARLQRQWGPWGLAWWEALLRAADQQASRENDQRARASLAPNAEAA